MTILLSNRQVWLWPSTYMNKRFKWTAVPNLFWNPCLDVEVMAQTSSVYDHFIIWPSSVALTFNLLEQMVPMNNCAKLFWNPCINVEVMAWASSIYDHYIIWPSSMTLTFKLPEKCFNEQLCHIILKSMHESRIYGPDKSGRTHDAHTPNWSCNSYVSLTASGINQKWSSKIGNQCTNEVGIRS